MANVWQWCGFFIILVVQLTVLILIERYDMFYQEYKEIRDAIDNLNSVLGKCFIVAPKGIPTINVGEDFGAPKAFVGGKKEDVDCFTQVQKIFLEKFMQQCIDSHNKEVSKDIHELYDRLGALSSSINNINEKVSKLKEDNLRLEGIIIELRNRTKTLERIHGGT